MPDVSVTYVPHKEGNNMSAEEIKEVYRRYTEEIWNKGRDDVIEEVVSPDLAIYYPAFPEPIRGIEGLKQFRATFQNAFPDLQFTLDDLVAEDDRVGVRWTGTGTHQGELMGIPPTGKRVTIQGMSWGRVQDGKLVENRIFSDDLGMMQQLGVIPAPGQ
jgi:steroid delta-isomerase-like uncharacterized protein